MIRMASTEYTKVAIQSWKEANDKQAKAIVRLQEALEFVAGEASFLSEAEAVAKQALKEEHP